MLEIISKYLALEAEAKAMRDRDWTANITEKVLEMSRLELQFEMQINNIAWNASMPSATKTVELARPAPPSPSTTVPAPAAGGFDIAKMRSEKVNKK